MKKITLLLLFLSSLWGYSQIKNYTLSKSTAESYPEITDGLQLTASTTIDDQYFVDPYPALGTNSAKTGGGIPMFDFVFNGVSYDRFGINANGMIFLGISTMSPAMSMDFANTTTPFTSTYSNTPEVLFTKISPLTRDLQAQTGSSLSYKIIGNSPDRTLIVQWKNYIRKFTTGEHLNFQVRLHETSNTIDFIYGDLVSSISTLYQAGLRAEPSTASTNFRLVTTTTDWANATIANGASSTITLSPSNPVVRPAIGFTYTWTPPACSDPKGLVYSDIVVTATEASLKWDYFKPVPTGFQFIVTTSSTVPLNTDNGKETTTASATVDKLSPNTSYNVYLRSACGTQWFLAGNFRTMCVPVPTLSDNFDSQTYDSANKPMPYCWTKAGTGNSYLISGMVSPASGNGLRMDATGSATPQVTYAITPQISNLNTVGNRFKFKAYATLANTTLEVGYFIDGTPATFTAIPTTDPMVLPITAATMKTFIVTPQQPIAGDVTKLVFKITGGTTGTTTVYIDDVIWEPTPGCTDLANVTVKTPTASSVQLSWDVTGTETDWQYAAVPSTVIDPSAIPAVSIVNVNQTALIANGANRSMTANNLTPNTSYKIWVRSKCGLGLYGYWSASPSFPTSCTPLSSSYVEDFDANLTIPDCWAKGVNGTMQVVAGKGQGGSNALEMTSATNVYSSFPPLGSATTAGYRMKLKCKSTVANTNIAIVSYDIPLSFNGSAAVTIIKEITMTTANADYTFNEVLTSTTPYVGLKVTSTSARSVYIDNISWEPVLTCPDVSAITQNEITDHSVKLGWNGSGTEADWQYAITNTQTADPNSLPVKDFIEPTVINLPTVTMAGNITGLSSSTNYKVWIRANCKNSATLGSWIGPFYFTTNYAAVKTFVQDFDDSLSMPPHWSKVGTAIASVTAMAGTSSPNVLKIEGKTGAGGQGIVAMEPVSNSGNATNILRFKLSGSVVGAKVEVGYLIDVTNPSTFRSLNRVFNVVSTTEYSTEAVELGFEPTSQILAFRNPGTSTTISTVYIDDVVWEALPTCPDVSIPTSTGITATAVGLTWTKGDSEDLWQYYLGSASDSTPAFDTPAAVNFVSPEMANQIVSGSIIGLTPSTNYKVWIRSKCANNLLGTWIGPYEFTTTCAPVPAFTERFDTNTNIPSCWTKVGTKGTVAVSTVNGGAPSGMNALSLTSFPTAKALIAMPPVSNSATGSYRLRFRLSSTVDNGNLQIGYVTNITDPTYETDPQKPTSFHLVEGVSATTAGLFVTKIINLGTNPTSEFLAFRNPDNSSTVFIDDVVWEPIPTCLDITAVKPGVITSNAANIKWHVSGSETVWQYGFGTITDSEPTLDPVDFVSPTSADSNVSGLISGLNPSTSYKIWIRSKCSDTSFGVWSDPLVFNTTCAPVDTFTENFDSTVSEKIPGCWNKVGSLGTAYALTTVSAPSGKNTFYMRTDSPAAPSIVALPAVSNASAGTQRLKFKFRGGNGSKLQIGYMDNILDPSSFHKLIDLVPSSSTIFESKIIELGTAPLTQVLAFKNPGYTSQVSLYIDDVVWEPIPTCADIKDLAVTSITSNSATFKWTADVSDIGWQYVKGGSTDVDPNLLTAVDVTGSPEVTLTDLSPATSYKVWVHSKCDDDVFGIWIPLTFKTACATVNAISENFDTTSGTNAIPGCWTKVGAQGSVYIKTMSDAPSGQHVLYMYSPNQQSQAVVAMPALSNLGDKAHILKFKFSGSAEKTGLDVGYLTDISDPNSFVLIKTFSTTVKDTYQQQSLVIYSAPASQVLAFRRPGYSALTVYVDDVSWAPISSIPACADVVATTNANCGNYSTLISWPAIATAAGYKLTVGGTTSGGTDVLNNQEFANNKLTYSVTGNPNTTYYYTLTPFNGLGDATGCLEQSFITNAAMCHCASVPTSKDGKGITNVTLGAANFAVSDLATITYKDFTEKQVNLTPGASTDLKISFNVASLSYNTNVWIDFNDNFIFESTEIVFSDVSENVASTVMNATFVMPADAPLGFHRMRIGAVLNSPEPDPCYSGSKGETLDFKVNLVVPPANDQALGAVDLKVGKVFTDNVVAGSNVNATGSAQETSPNCGNYSGSDVWYKAVVPASGNITFEVNSIATGITNTAAAVYTSNMVLIACDDSSSTTGKSVIGDDQPKITLTGRTPDEILYLRVWENGGDAYGSYEISAYDNSLSADAFELGKFAYYPNPVNDVLNISFDQEISDITVMNMLGQQLISKSVNANETKIDMSDLSRGTYLVKITAGNQSKTIKAIKR